MLSESGGDILEDEELINTLRASKVTSTEINCKLGEAEKSEARINESRVSYMPYATMLYMPHCYSSALRSAKLSPCTNTRSIGL